MSDPEEKLSADELAQACKDKTLSGIIFKELKAEVEEGELMTIQKEIAELTELNMTNNGGSEQGYFYDNEAFPVVSEEGRAGFKMSNLQPIDPSLAGRAHAVKENRIELAQDMTYIGNFLSVVSSKADSYMVFLANLPIEIATFCPSVRRLQRKADNEYPQWREQFKLDRAEPEFAVFYMHYDRAEPRLKRYLFRRVTN